MSIKSLIQIILLSLIIVIIGSVYFRYFDTKKTFDNEVNQTEINNTKQLQELEKKILDLELQNEKLSQKIKNNESIKSEIFSTKNDEKKEEISENKEVEIVKNKEVEASKNKVVKENIKNNIKIKKEVVKNKNKKKSHTEKKIKNLVKDVEYTSVDQKGNKFYLLATSGKSNVENNDILDLTNVRGKITSDIRDTIYIVSDFAEYNSVSLNSKFYENVVINFQDKEINCINFDINMENNKAVAYNDVIITDPKSVIKAGIVEFDLKTKDIDILPESALTDINVKTN